ncbi:MAG TPA: aminotransferase class V-fold PLP-dependent enzyme [Candidatus Nanoarchaeia archaeon]|nr:aminotransferase class V-fold PLP-dependent enzyme [Candidatus Nanoarchaeia archaeon]
MALNTASIRKDFPLLCQKKSPVYFDNACTTLRPAQVLQKIREYYEQYPSCGGRSHHKIGERVTEEVLKARKTVSDFFNAKSESEMIFTRNTTEGINLVCNSLRLKKGDTVLCSDKEHNSNLVPWLEAGKRGMRHKIFSFGNIEDFKRKIKGIKFVSIVQTSNVDGSSQDIKEMTGIAHDNNALVLIDAAQSAPHKEVNVRKIDCDFLACSSHKMLGPSGMGLLYGKTAALEQLNQFLVGGDTVTNTTFSSFTPEKIPERFEAGLQDYAGIIGAAEAVRYLKKIGLSNIEKHEHALNAKLSEGLTGLGAQILGPEEPELRSGIVSFNVKNLDPHNVALMLDAQNIMIRSGMHCVHSWFNANRLKGSARASLYLYNTPEEVDMMVEQMRKIVKLA